jgi:hypothetical protein
MVDAPNPVHNPNDPNHSLNRRRDEKAAEQMLQDNAQRLSDITACGIEAWQKQIEVTTHMARYWADMLETTQRTFGQFTSHIQNQTRRSA